tara:strand:- start:65 stop:622 length:558 start_codon:yes stop_codon:yes gene_type:complete
MNRELLNEYINKYKISELIEYISNKYNLQEEKLSIKLIDTFQNKELTIDKVSQFIVILNNTIHDEITINNTNFEEILMIDDNSNIEINSDVTYSDIKYILIENNSTKNSIENKNKYIKGDIIFLINNSNIINDEDCKLVKKFIDNYIENKLVDTTCSYPSVSIFFYSLGQKKDMLTEGRDGNGVP